ncbi:hypothetical protein CDAR_517271, partial [Caerostris darwini]
LSDLSGNKLRASHSQSPQKLVPSLGNDSLSSHGKQVPVHLRLLMWAIFLAWKRQHVVVGGQLYRQQNLTQMSQAQRRNKPPIRSRKSKQAEKPSFDVEGFLSVSWSNLKIKTKN